MKILFLIAVAVITSQSVLAQDCSDKCKSELLRVEVSPQVLSNEGFQALLPNLRTLSGSEALQESLEREFPITPISFPHNKDTCKRRKAESDPSFARIDCDAKALCSDPNLDINVRGKICFSLPCPLLEGTLNVGKCDGVQNIYPATITFPQPVKINKIRLEPTQVTVVDDKAKLCFKINALDVQVGVALGLNTQGTSLPDKQIRVDNIHPLLDSPREACITAKIKLGDKTPVTDMEITTPAGKPFISDNMIRAAAQGLSIKGLSGYPSSELAQVQNELVPVLFQPLRDSVESGIKDGLSQVFTEELNKIAKTSAMASIPIDSHSFSSELGIGNVMVRNQVAVLECASLNAAGRPIPRNHACIGIQSYNQPIDQSFHSPIVNELMTLRDQFKDKNVSSESIKQRLIALKEVILAEEYCCSFPNDSESRKEENRKMQRETNLRMYNEYVAPLINQISNTQMQTTLPSLFEIHNQVNNRAGRNIGLSLPEMCATRPSPHANRSMRNCPVQVYADLTEFNKLLTKMWESGGMCMKGKGKFTPEMVGGARSFDNDGAPKATGGCYLEAGGMGCYLKSAPQINYDSATKKFKTAVQLQECFRGPVALGQGRFGGDFNINLSYKPTACSNGDFCVQEPTADWKVVPGSERYALRPTSYLHDMVTDKIQEAIGGALANTMRIPLSSSVGAMASFPLESEGRVDAGNGFFGVCMQPRDDLQGAIGQ